MSRLGARKEVRMTKSRLISQTILSLVMLIIVGFIVYEMFDLVITSEIEVGATDVSMYKLMEVFLLALFPTAFVAGTGQNILKYKKQQANPTAPSPPTTLPFSSRSAPPASPTAVVRFCPACGKELPSAKNFCPFCGQTLREQAP